MARVACKGARGRGHFLSVTNDRVGALRPKAALLECLGSVRRNLPDIGSGGVGCASGRHKALRRAHSCDIWR